MLTCLLIRLFVPHSLAAADEHKLSEPHAHYLANVMRRTAGDSVLLFNGRDGEAEATITTLNRGRGTLRIARQTRPQTPEPDIWLLFAPLKRDNTDLVIQKATELGAAQIFPVLTARSNTTRLNPERLAAIAQEAAEQSERLTIPVIHAAKPLFETLATWPENRTLAAAIERAGPAPIPQAMSLLIGPEGGFAPAELDALRALRFMMPISLGPRILRAETAVIAGLALLQGAGWSTT